MINGLKTWTNMELLLEGSFPFQRQAPCLWQGLGGFGGVQGCAELGFSQLCVGVSSQVTLG